LTMIKTNNDMETLVYMEECAADAFEKSCLRRVLMANCRPWG